MEEIREVLENQIKIENRSMELITQEIQFYKGQAGQMIIEIGKRLLEAKAQLPHGGWSDWLEKEVEFSDRTAQNFMRIAREYQNPKILSVLGNSTSKAILLLALSPAEQQDFVAQPHEVHGELKTVAEMTTKEFEKLMKQIQDGKKENEEFIEYTVRIPMKGNSKS